MKVFFQFTQFTEIVMKLWNADDGTYVNIVLITLENEMKNNTRRIGHEKKNAHSHERFKVRNYRNALI